MDMPAIIHQIEQCAPSAPSAIVEAIIRTESGFNPIAINVNHGFKLARQPASRQEAEVWARWLLSNGHNFDAGLMQINSANWERLGLRPENVFDACENVRSGAKVFGENLKRAEATFGPGQSSILSALSAYNTGDFVSGVRNGYVSKVVRNIGSNDTEIEERPHLVPTSGDPARSGANVERNSKTPNHENSNPFMTPSAVEGFTTFEPEPWGDTPEMKNGMHLRKSEKPPTPNRHDRLKFPTGEEVRMTLGTNQHGRISDCEWFLSGSSALF